MKKVHSIYGMLSTVATETDSAHSYDVDKIRAAYELAYEAHQGQMRSSGEAFISHPLAVADIMLELHMDTDTVVAALLHDVVEDTSINIDLLRKKFGAEVALMVDGVTKLDQVPLNITKEEEHAENIRKILIHMTQDIRVMLIKLADRLHNMRTLEFRPPEKQKETALETMSFYAPIAHRLGINSIKEEIEDLSIRYLDPYGYNEVKKQIEQRKDLRDAFINRTKELILSRVSDIKPQPVIEGRIKSVYSIYKKMYLEGKTFDEIFDIYAVRIIVELDIECYNVLGVVHDLFRPIPGRFKDYIGNPKPNRYQSLHTTVIGKEGKIPFEVQIRTHDMHNTAEYGIAAHWRYKSGLRKGKGGAASVENKIQWIHHILDQQQEDGDVRQITEAIKTDLDADDVYVFTPKGDIITLPVGSTVIDFAYAIHTEVGNKMTGAKVGGRMAGYDYQLVTGDIVDIMTTNSSDYGPNRDWLDIVKTAQAKSRIRAWFRKERRSENISTGRSMLQRELRRNNIPYDENCLDRAAHELRYDDIDEFMAAIGYGGIGLTRAVEKIRSVHDAAVKPSPVCLPELEIKEHISKKQAKGVIVEDVEGCVIRFAQCCTPLPGDDIIGFITRGYGVSVHKKSCVNVDNDKTPDRWVRVTWIEQEDVYYRAAVELIAEDMASLLSDVTTCLFASRLKVGDFFYKRLKNGNICIETNVEIASTEQLTGLLAKLRKVQGVIQATRKEI